MILTVKPIVNLEGVVDQVSFVISDIGKSFSDPKTSHINLEAARIKQQAAVEVFKEKLLGSEDLIQRLEILKRMQEDLLYATELEDHTIGDKPELTDIAELCKRVVITEESFAGSLKVNLNFSLLNFNSDDTEKIVPRGLNISPINLTAPFFTSPVDVKWFNILVQKLLGLAILLSSSIPNSTAALFLDRDGDKIVIVKFFIDYPGLAEEESKFLLTQYYGPLSNTTNLHFGSGLEGFIARQIALALNIPLSVVSQKGTRGINIILKVSKAVA